MTKKKVGAAMEPVAAAVPDSLHALERAPVNSKIVGTTDGAVFATPDGALLFPKDDVANRLPVGARIRKTAEHEYVADQMDATDARPALVTGTALEAIEQFVAHFHG